MVRSFNPVNVWQPFGPFAMVVAAGDGRTIHLKGQVALDRDGSVVGRGDMRAQVEKTLENIQTVLNGIGGDMSDILSLTHYTSDIDAFMQTGDIRSRYFAAPYPVTTTVQVTRLYRPDLLIEITVIAEIPEERLRLPA